MPDDLDDIDLALPRPAAPSPTQSHGTVMVALLCGFVGLAFLFWWSIRGVGPFTGTVTGTSVGNGSATLPVQIHNEGRKGGHAKCHIERLSGSNLQTAHRFLSERVPGHGTITQQVTMSLAPDERPGQLAC